MTYNAHAWPPDAAVNREAAPLTSSDMLAGTLTVYCRAGDDLTGHGSLRIQQGTAGAWIVARVEKVPEGSDCGDGPVDPNRRLSAVNAAAVARQQALTVHRERVADGVPRVWLDGNVLKRVLGVVDGQQVHVNALEDPHPNVDDTQHDAFWHSIVLRLRRQDTDTCAALALDLVNVDSLHKSLCGRAIANGQHMLLPLINGAFVVVVIEAYPGVTSDSSDNPAMLRCVNSATRILFRTDTSPLPRLPVEGDDDAALMLLRKCFGFTARRYEGRWYR